MWRETKTAGIHGHTVVISIHSLRVEGDRKLLVPSDTLDISIHSLRVEGDTSSKKPLTCYKKFQSTPSVWRETLCSIIDIVRRSISIHSLRVEGDNAPLAQHVPIAISIHSLRVEGDGLMYREVQRAEISIHSLRVEGDNPVR